MKRFRPGVSFGDFVVQDFKKGKSMVKEESVRNYRRGWLVWLTIVIAFGLLIVRSAELQIFEGGKYRVLADENRIKQIKLPASRGLIYDRNGIVLAENVKEEYAALDNRVKVSGWKRSYPFGKATAHVIGYLGEVGEDEVGILKEAGQKYSPGDWVGRMGLERWYETDLRGVDGGWLAEVDNMGNIARELGKKQDIPGKNLTTTLDSGLQNEAYIAMKDKKGAVVISNPNTGEILALVSSPSFNPNYLVGRTSNLKQLDIKNIQEILTDKNLVLFNRAIGGGYAPGSTFKMITTIAAIESGKVKPDFTYEDRGIISVNGYDYTNWLFSKRGGTEGTLGFVRAITRSTDTFFYKVGELTSAETMAQWAEKMGLGEKSNIELEGEAQGVVGTPDWKMNTYGEKWFLGNTYHMAIGQGDTLATPLQINIMTGILASSGKKCQPKLNKMAKDQCSVINIAQKTLESIKTGMIGACSPDGTAYPLFDWNEAAKEAKFKSIYANRMDGNLPVIACKTGTAEYVAEDGKIRTHGWLTAYSPADKPQITITVLMEGGGEGSDVAAPIVRKVLAKYFNVTDTYPYENIRKGLGE